MPRDSADGPPQPLDIAVIGTGIAGMSAAWLLAKRHNVSVYEQDERIGGHSNTIEAPGPDGPIPVDTGFIVYNELNYPNLTALFAHLGVPTQASDMSFAVSIDDGALEYAGSDFNGLIGAAAQRPAAALLADARATSSGSTARARRCFPRPMRRR